MTTSLNNHNHQTRLLLVGPLPPPETGQSVSFEMLCHEVVNRGVSEDIVDLSRNSESTKPGFSTRRLVEMLIILSYFFVALLRRPDNVYITIAQSKSGFMRDAVMIWLCKLLKARVVVHLKGGNYNGFYAKQNPRLQSFIRLTLKQVDKILVLGEGLKAMYDFEPGLSTKLSVVPNGLPIDLEPMKKSIPAQMSHEPIRLLFLSNLIQTKGYLHILEALHILNNAHSRRFHCTFAGRFLPSADDEIPLSQVEAKQHFFKTVDRLQLNDIVDYVGPVSGKCKWDLLEKAHIFLLPTKYVNEGQPVSIIEAMAHGCPCITTNFRAIPDLVVDGVTGSLIDYGEPNQIAESIANLTSDNAKFNTMSTAVIDRYQRLFTRTAHLERILPLLLGTEENAVLESDTGIKN